MEFRFFMPTKIFFGANCLADHADEFTAWGKRALIVTGRNSAKLSGALPDLCLALDRQGIAWQLYDQIGENPSFVMVEAGGAAARKFAPDMIVAIGGGSPLDAAKAIAVLATNDMPAIKLYDGNFAAPPLPLLAIPITAGTGSEVTPYSILTDADRETKRSFSAPSLFPRAAFLDPRYTYSLSHKVTVDTAVDAMSHNLEGYLSRRSTPASDALALEALGRFGSALDSLHSGCVTAADRALLLYVSLLGGMVISQTGTTVVHSLGYSLTYFKGVPHGQANGLLLGSYLEFVEPAAPGKVRAVLQALRLASVAEFQDRMRSLFPVAPALTDAELDHYARLAAKTANIGYTARQPVHEDLKWLLRDSLTR